MKFVIHRRQPKLWKMLIWLTFFNVGMILLAFYIFYPKIHNVIESTLYTLASILKDDQVQLWERESSFPLTAYNQWVQFFLVLSLSSLRNMTQDKPQGLNQTNYVHRLTRLAWEEDSKATRTSLDDLRKNLTIEGFTDIIHLIAHNRPNDTFLYGLSHLVNNTNDSYTYNVSTTVVGEYLCIAIEERHLGEMTYGGAGFKIELFNNQTRYFLSFEDHFNGSYTSSCKTPGDCVTVNITQTYTNFTQYGRDPMLTANIYLKTWCPERTHARKNILPECTHREHFNTSPRVGMFDLDNDTRVYEPKSPKWTARKEHCLLPRYDQLRTTACVKSLQQLHFVGDSHMRYSFYHILQGIGQFDGTEFEQKLMKDTTVGNVRFYWRPKPADTVAFLRFLLRNVTVTLDKPLGQDYVICINTGAHPLSQKSFMLSILDMESVYEAFKELKKHPLWTNARFIWLTTVSFVDAPAFLYRSPLKGHTSNYQVAAFNWWVGLNVARLGVEVFDQFQYTYPFSDRRDNDCGMHFSCTKGRRGMGGWKGYNNMDALTHTLCKPA